MSKKPIHEREELRQGMHNDFRRASRGRSGVRQRLKHCVMKPHNYRATLKMKRTA